MPRLRPLPAKKPELEEEPEISMPIDGDIEIELSGDDLTSTEIELAPEPEKKPEPKAEDDNPLKKALEAQQRAEEMQRTAQRERDEAVRQAREHQEELTRERGERQDAEYNSVLTAIAAEQSTLEKAESDYAAFAAAGDWANAAKAQRIMASAASRVDRLEDSKQAFEGKREAAKTETKPAPQPQGFEQRIAALPENAKGWLRKHPEFINDNAMNRKIQAAHGAIVDLDGVEAFSAAYFDALDTKFGFKQAETSQRNETETSKPQPKQRNMPMVAPVSRDVPSPSGQRQSSTKVTLTEEERRIARTSFTAPDMTDAQKEHLYAKNKMRLAAMKANGSYSERRE